MFTRKKYSKGQSTTEYIFFFVLLLSVFIYFQKYIVRGINGRLKTVGDSFADGRLYDPTNTVFECAFDYQYTNEWYDAKCYFGDSATPGCGISNCLAATSSINACMTCISSCVPPQGY
jgi:hypothetical protein